MKRNNKKGFTIVELVIVIAVIAILAAVLIPTFSSVIKKAKVNNDIQLVRNLNTALAADTKEHKTMQAALDAAAEFGYDVAKINASATDNEILWDSVNDVFCYLKDGKIEYIPNSVSGTVSLNANDYRLWKISDTVDAIYSTYYVGSAGSATTINTTKGFDAGKTTGITAINYKNEDAQQNAVVIRTNGGTLTVKAPADTVNHYGVAEKVTIEDIAPDSYHEFGYVTSYIQVNDGHVVIESGASVSIVAVNGADVTLDQKSGSELFKVRPVGSLTIDTSKIKVDSGKIDNTSIADTNALANMKYGGGNGTAESSAYELYTASHLVAFANDVNNGVYTNYVYAKLCADVDISGMGWEPIGNGLSPFYGSFDGNNKTISGLTNKGYTAKETLWGMTSNAKNTGTAYGFFGVVGLTKNLDNNAAPNEIVLKNINFTNVNIDTGSANMLGVLLGADVAAAKIGEPYVNKDYNGNISISGITTAGSIKSTCGTSLGGIVGKLYTQGKVTIDSCINNCAIYATNVNEVNPSDIKLGGILGYSQSKDSISDNSKRTITNCKNNGSIKIDNKSAQVFVSGIFGATAQTNLNITISKCTSAGNISITGANKYQVAAIASFNGTYDITHREIKDCDYSSVTITVNGQIVAVNDGVSTVAVSNQ